MRLILLACFGLVALAAAARGQQGPEPLGVDSDLRRDAARAYMNGVLARSMTDVWNAIGFDGEPVSDATWAEARERALTLAAHGETLKTAPFALDDGFWVDMADTLVSTAERAARAAEAQDVAAYYAAGEDILGTCEPCHVAYLEPLSPPAE